MKRRFFDPKGAGQYAFLVAIVTNPPALVALVVSAICFYLAFHLS